MPVDLAAYELDKGLGWRLRISILESEIRSIFRLFWPVSHQKHLKHFALYNKGEIEFISLSLHFNRLHYILQVYITLVIYSII